MVGWVKVAQREGGSSPTADCACGGLCSLEVNPATEDPPHHHIWLDPPYKCESFEALVQVSLIHLMLKRHAPDPNVHQAELFFSHQVTVLPSLFVMESKGAGSRDQRSEKPGKSLHFLPTTH